MSKQVILDALRDVSTHLETATQADDYDGIRAAVLNAKDCIAAATQAAMDLPPADNGTRIAEDSVTDLPAADPVGEPVEGDTDPSAKTTDDPEAK